MDLSSRLFSLITTDAELRRGVAALRAHESVAVDTESNSMFAYRERLCLLQLSSRELDMLVDPLAIRDFAPLVELFEDPTVEKVFHDGEFDLTLIRAAMGVSVRHVYDTKIAAVAVGSQICGLAPLLEAHFGVQLDKRHQLSDWGARPLTPEQIEYARRDTAYLLPLADLLEARVELLGGVVPDEVRSECLRLERLMLERRPFDPEGWVAIHGARKLDPVGRRVLRELFAWRDGEARLRDVPPFRIASNANLIDLARLRPRAMSDMEGIRTVPPAITRRHGRELLATVQAALAMEPILRFPSTDNGTPWTDQERAAVDRLKRWRKDRALQRPTDPSHILARTIVEELARRRPATLHALGETGLLEPWRIDAYGSEILAALHAELAASKRPHVGGDARHRHGH